MNERIKELEKQCWSHRVNGRLVDGQLHFDTQKFAELIVQECAEQSMSIGRYNTPSGITPDLSIAIAVGLKKHFGVEE